MNTYKTNIESKTLRNRNYRKVLYTTRELQLVVMSVKDYIPKERHSHTTQFIRVEKGRAKVEIGKNKIKKKYLYPDDIIIIPAGTYHYIENIGKGDLKLYTIYSPPEHPPNTVEKERE